MLRVLMFALMALAWSPAVHAIELSLPLNCTPQQDCWIPRYVDLDQGPGVKDYACGDLTGNGHKGTDFAIRNLAAMRAGVPVIAAADGVVRATRDGEIDINVQDPNAPNVGGKECGTGVVIAHDDGYETQYCHLRNGSIAVAPGENVTRGTMLGLVGLSGDTSFPHVHLSVRRDGNVVDPFLGGNGDQRPVARACAMATEPLWRADLLADLSYQRLMITNIGLADGQVDWDEIKNGRLDRPPTSALSSALVVAFDGYGLKAGDQITTRIDGPQSWRHEATEIAERGHANFMRFSGRRAPQGGFAKGDYTAEVVVRRDGHGIIAVARSAATLQ